MSPRLVSIIIPALDEARTIGATLEPLQPLRKAGCEVLLVDGGSRDGTLEAAAGLVDRVVTGCCGRARQMNAGAAAARGEVLVFLHADTRLGPEHVEAMRTALDTGRHWGRCDVRLSGAQRAFRVIETAMNLRSCLTGIATGDQAMFMRRRAYDRAGGFPDIPLMEDIALSRRLRRLGRPACVRPPVVTSSRRWEDNGILRTVLLMWWLRLAFFLGADPTDLVRRYRNHGG